MLKNKLVQNWAVPPNWLKFLIATLLILGLFFRLANLDRKVYWFDETYTSLRTAGFTETELVEDLTNPEIINQATFQKYQQNNLQKSFGDTITSLAIEDPQHPPFYYLLAKIWMQGFGSSVTVMRSLPALISLLAFPSIYWLCLELFASPLTGWIAVSLLAVSPLHILYAQEAREYSLWTVSILVLSAAFLRAIRQQNRLSWLIYGLTLTISLYTFLLSFLVAIGQGIYIVILEKFKLTKTLIAYLLATTIGFIAFLPWIAVVLVNRVQAQSVTAWTGVIKKPLGEMLKIWGINFSRVFLDFNYSSTDALIYQLFLALAIILLLALFCYSLYFLCRNTPQRIWLFILTSMGTIMLPFVIPDLVSGGVRSITPRYFIPCYLGIQLSVAYLLAHKIVGIKNTGQQKIWQFVMASLITLGVASSVINSQAKTWWHQTLNRDTPAVAAIINQAKNPLVISNSNSANLLSLSYLLNPNVQFLYKPKCYTSCNIINRKHKKVEDIEDKPNLPNIPNGFSDVFLFEISPSPEWVSQLGKNQPYKIETKLKPSSEELLSWLWRIEKP